MIVVAVAGAAGLEVVGGFAIVVAFAAVVAVAVDDCSVAVAKMVAVGVESGAGIG